QPTLLRRCLRRTLLCCTRGCGGSRALVRCWCRVARIDDLDMSDLRWIVRPVVAFIACQPRDLFYHVEVLTLSEDCVLAVEVRCGNFGDEELRTVGIRPAVGHRQAAGLVEGQVGGELILKVVAWAARSVARRVA